MNERQSPGSAALDALPGRLIEATEMARDTEAAVGELIRVTSDGVEQSIRLLIDAIGRRVDAAKSEGVALTMFMSQVAAAERAAVVGTLHEVVEGLAAPMPTARRELAMRTASARLSALLNALPMVEAT